MDTYLYLLTAKFNDKGKLATVCVTNVSDKKTSLFESDESSSAGTKLAKLLNSLPPFQSSVSPFRPSDDVQFVGFGVRAIMHAVWLENMCPDARGHFPNMLPMWVADPRRACDPGALLSRGSRPWVNFLTDLGFSYFPDGWEKVHDDPVFDMNTLVGLCLKLRIITQEIKDAG